MSAAMKLIACAVAIFLAIGILVGFGFGMYCLHFFMQWL
jgi:hypothetical protein